MKKLKIVFIYVLWVLVILNGVIAVVTTKVETEAWRVGTSSKKLEMTENTDTWNGETIRNIMTSIDEDELKILEDGSITNEKGTAGYNQYINFEDANKKGGFVKFLENDGDIVGDFLYFMSGSQIARYFLEFKTSFQSDVENENGDNDPTGTYLGDFEGTKIKILGEEYEIIKARRVTSTGNSIELTLIGDSIKDLLEEKSTKTYNFNGKNYSVEAAVITNSAPITVKFRVNGDLLKSLSKGQTFTLLDGAVIGVSEILLNDGDNESDYVKFLLGTSKIFLRDTNIVDRVSSVDLEVGSEKIDDTHVIITGSDDNETFSIDAIQLNITADDDYFVAAGHSLTEYMDEPQAFLESWDIKYGGLDPSIELETYKIKTSGSDTYKLEFTDGDGLQATIPILYTNGSNIRFGDNDDDLILKGSMKIQKNDYLIVSDYSKEDGRRKTYALRYKGADKVASGETALVKFDNLGNGTRIEVPFTENDGDTPDATLTLGKVNFKVINASDGRVDDFDIWVDLDADGIIQNDNDIITINTNAGMKIVLDNKTSSGYVLATFSTPNEKDYNNIVPTPIKLKLGGASNDKVYFDEATDSIINWVTPSEQPNVKYAYTSRGAKFKWDNPINDPDLLTIEYPKRQRLPLVYVVGYPPTIDFSTIDSTIQTFLHDSDSFYIVVGSKATAEDVIAATNIAGSFQYYAIQNCPASTTCRLNPTKLDSEIDSPYNTNIVSVGRPHHNTITNLFLPSSLWPLEQNTALISRFVHSDTATLAIAGNNDWDTRQASEVIANFDEYNLNDTCFKVNTSDVDNLVLDKCNFSIYPVVRRLGDVNGDAEVNILDLILARNAIGTKQGDPYWNDEADMNKDGEINILDLIIIRNNFT